MNKYTKNRPALSFEKRGASFLLFTAYIDYFLSAIAACAAASLAIGTRNGEQDT